MYDLWFMIGVIAMNHKSVVNLKIIRDMRQVQNINKRMPVSRTLPAKKTIIEAIEKRRHKEDLESELCFGLPYSRGHVSLDNRVWSLNEESHLTLPARKMLCFPAPHRMI
ncbi:MAG: hypothetical protein ACLRS8_18280 [Parabacteroides merdae]